MWTLLLVDDLRFSALLTSLSFVFDQLTEFIVHDCMCACIHDDVMFRTAPILRFSLKLKPLRSICLSGHTLHTHLKIFFVRFRIFGDGAVCDKVLLDLDPYNVIAMAICLFSFFFNWQTVVTVRCSSSHHCLSPAKFCLYYKIWFIDRLNRYSIHRRYLFIHFAVSAEWN